MDADLSAADVERVAIAIRGAMRMGDTMSEIAAAAMRETRLIDAEAALAVADGANPETIKVRGWKLFADWLKGRAA